MAYKKLKGVTPKNSDVLLQIVVMAGGTNDFHGDLPPLEQWVSDNLNFMSEVRGSTAMTNAAAAHADSRHFMCPLPM